MQHAVSIGRDFLDLDSRVGCECLGVVCPKLGNHTSKGRDLPVAYPSNRRDLPVAYREGETCERYLCAAHRYPGIKSSKIEAVV